MKIDLERNPEEVTTDSIVGFSSFNRRAVSKESAQAAAS